MRAGGSVERKPPAFQARETSGPEKSSHRGQRCRGAAGGCDRGGRHSGTLTGPWGPPLEPQSLLCLHASAFPGCRTASPAQSPGEQPRRCSPKRLASPWLALSPERKQQRGGERSILRTPQAPRMPQRLRLSPGHEVEAEQVTPTAARGQPRDVACWSEAWGLGPQGTRLGHTRGRASREEWQHPDLRAHA